MFSATGKAGTEQRNETGTHCDHAHPCTRAGASALHRAASGQEGKTAHTLGLGLGHAIGCLEKANSSWIYGGDQTQRGSISAKG